jgi:hypothetical protein
VLMDQVLRDDTTPDDLRPAPLTPETPFHLTSQSDEHCTRSRGVPDEGRR